MRKILPVLLVILASFGAATTRLEISGDTIILSYSDSRDAVIFRREESNTGFISPMKIDIPGTWTLDAKPPEIPDISRNKLWPGISGDNYSYTLMSTAPAEWHVSGLPRGLSCSSNGKISGVPSESGTFSVDIKASNIAGSVNQTFPLKIFADPLPRILTLELPIAVINVSYDFKLPMNDSPASILMAEKLPEGLTLDNDGKIRGIPVEAGDYVLD
ncbi:MAG: putative Ig domain-containing protein, partial [Synergistaceae bacterium]|nr:putative Ig domain-containing protein [Synergistaceae bacterium]